MKTAPVEVEVYSRGRRRRFRTGAVCMEQFKDGRVVRRADATALNTRIWDKMEEVNAATFNKFFPALAAFLFVFFILHDSDILITFVLWDW